MVKERNEAEAEAELLIQEVDEDLRRDQYAELFKKYGNVAVAGALTLVLGVAGYQGWETWRAKVRLEQASRYAAAASLAEVGKPADAAVALGRVAADAPPGYAALAQLQRGALLAQTGDIAGAVAAYDALAANAAVPEAYRQLALVQGALLSVDTAEPALLEKKIEPLAAATNPWHHAVLEIKALLAAKRGESGAALDLYARLSDDATTPPALRRRAAEMLQVLSADAKSKG